MSLYRCTTDARAGDAAAVDRDFVKRARNYRMGSGMHDDDLALVGNISIQGFPGLCDPEFRTTAQPQRDLDVSAEVAWDRNWAETR